jgi:hypothetical protein
MRLSEELRGRTKNYASTVIRLYVQLPKAREEVRVLGKQLLRSGTPALTVAPQSVQGGNHFLFEIWQRMW